MKKLFFLAMVILMIVSCNQKPAHEDHSTMMKMDSCCVIDSLRDGVFIHISEGYNDPHKVLMPLKMALMMSHDKAVLVYMDIKAVELLVKGSKDLNYGDFESAHTYIKKLAEMKVGVYACPTCLKIAGYKPEDLIEGVQIAQKDKFFDFTKGRIITLDY
jgi:predicted peroxiredoxin